MTNCICTMLRTVVVCAFYVGLTRSAPLSDITGYDCNNIPDVKECTTSHHYCYLKGSAYVPCFRICQIEVYDTVDVERCQAECSEYFAKECKPVRATSKVTPVSTTPFSSTSTAVSATDNQAMPSSSMEPWVIGLIVGAVVIVVIVIIIVAVVLCRTNRSTNNQSSNLATACGCCNRISQSTSASFSLGGTPHTTDMSNSSPSTGNDSAPTGNDSAPTGNGSAPTGNGSAPTGNGSAPTGNGSAPTGNGSAPTGNGSAPTGNDGEPPEETEDDSIALLPISAQTPLSTPIPVSESHNQQPTCH